MSHPDWTNVGSVRPWLEKRYAATNRQDGSPFFQYLKDELAKGNKLKGRERHLSGDELLRWLEDTQGYNAFHYRMGEMQVTYYPEYNSETSPSSSQIPTEDGDWSEREASKVPEVRSTYHAIDKQSQTRAKTKSKPKPQKGKVAQKRRNAKAKTWTSFSGNDDTKSSKTNVSTSRTQTNVTGKTKGVATSNPKALRKQKVGASTRTLRPRRGSKRANTDFFYSDDRSRAKRAS